MHSMLAVEQALCAELLMESEGQPLPWKCSPYNLKGQQNKSLSLRLSLFLSEAGKA